MAASERMVHSRMPCSYSRSFSLRWSVRARPVCCPDENDRPADGIQCFHDIRLVRASAFPGIASLDCDYCELDDCVSGVLLPGAGKPNWVVSIHDRAAEDHSGSDYADCVLGFLCNVPPRIFSLELPGRVWPHRGGGVLHVLRVTANGWSG